MEIKTDRLVLNPLNERDIDDVFAYASDPEVSRNTSWPAHESPADTRAFIEYVERKHNAEPGSLHLVWAIHLKSEDRVIGTVSFGQDNETEGHLDYALAREYWGKGYTTEAVRAVIDWAFREVTQLEKINSGCLSRNVGSVRVLEKAGFKVTERYESRRMGKFQGAVLETTLFCLDRKVQQELEI